MASPAITAAYVTRKPGVVDPLGERAGRLLVASGLGELAAEHVCTTRVFVFEGLETRAAKAAETLARLLVNPVLEAIDLDRDPHDRPGWICLDIGRRPGVTEPVEASVLKGLGFLGASAAALHVRTRTWLPPGSDPARALAAARRFLANDVVDEVHLGAVAPAARGAPAPYHFVLTSVRLAGLDGAALEALGRERGLAMTRLELEAVRAHFATLGRDPTDIELETIAQTWSEHCKHKTLTSPIDFDGRRIDNLLVQTIKRVTEEIAAPWCWSVFADNAGVIALDDEQGIAVKVETHNHPSAIEPYGGAGTGVGGVIRDILGTGLGARPFAATDVFAFAPPDLPAARVPRGSLHPRRVLEGVVAGVRDYGNRMGIPTVAGALYFDERYVGNPLVFCGCLGVIPRRYVRKAALPGDLIVTLGGRTGRDGIHGATFSSLELSESSETLSSGAVQIGDPITEKRLVDVILTARDRGLFRALTDCGAGGYSSAVGEMAEETGARIYLERVPLKYAGLSYSEIWISEAQERMVAAVPPAARAELEALCAEEDVELTVIGELTETRRLELYYAGHRVGDLAMRFLHHGVPRAVQQATWSAPPERAFAPPADIDIGAALAGVLASPTVASKAWIIRQYDHEVQGGTIGKPLVGAHMDGPADAAVVLPILGNPRAVAIAIGASPRTGDLDPFRMGKLAVDEAVRNLIAAGAPAERIALLDNFAWARCTRPSELGSLVLAAEGAAAAARAFAAPFISGKDSLANEMVTSDGIIAIPPTLVITAVAVLESAARLKTMDAKRAGHRLVLVGETRDDLGGSELARWLRESGGKVGDVDLERAPRTMARVAAALARNLAASAHDVSEGGIAVAVAEMAIAGDLGFDLQVPDATGLDSARWLFSESPTRFLLEVAPDDLAALGAALAGETWVEIGGFVAGPAWKITRGGRNLAQGSVATLRRAWQEPLDFDRAPRSETRA